MATRRQFLTALATATGGSGVYTAARAMGLTEGETAPAGWSGPPSLAPGSGRGARVAILGAGVAGLAAAYELGRAGYNCTVLEARERVGGRNLTLRRGARLTMNDGADQVCGFDEGHYFNAGPARIPSHHQATLGYCRELGVPMETLVNHSMSGLIQADDLNGGRPIQMRQAIFDTRGRIAELMAKATRNGGLDREMTAEDRDRLMDGIGTWGGLGPRRRRIPGEPAPKVQSFVYGRNAASGWETPPGAGAQLGVPREALPMAALTHPLVGLASTFHEIIDMQETMLQPVGGMDAIPAAFAAKLGPVVKLGCPVTAIRRRGAGVEISYSDHGRPRALAADYCIVTVPLKVLAPIPADFSPDRRAAIARTVYAEAIKVAFQSPRFWETDNQIYGGLSFSGRDTFITWYPSSGFMQPEGVLVAGYSFGAAAKRFGALPLDGRLAYAKATVERLHSGRSRQLKHGITVTWSQVPYSLGIEAPLGENDPAAYDLLSQADGPFYFAGEHLSHCGAWQQGAFLSAQRTVAMLDARHRQGRPVAEARLQ